MPADLCPSLKRFAPKRRNREGSTLLLIAVSALSLVVVPFVGVCLSRGLAAQAVRQLEATSSDDVQRRCAQLANAVPFTADSCDLLSSARLIEHTYIASVALLVLVLLSFWLATLTVARSREKLSRLFPVAVRACLAAVVLTFLIQGTLLSWLMWERAVAGHYEFGLPGMLFGAGLVIGFLTMIWSWRERLQEVPVPVTGIIVEPGQFGELQHRIELVAARLRTPPPRRLIVGLEPTAFVTTAAIDLQGTGVVPATETLYLPLGGIRLWNDRELDAVIGHELGHFRADDLRCTQRLMPAIRSFMLSLESLDPEKRRWVSVLGSSTLPAVCMLHGMLWLVLRAVSKNDRQRELAADQAAASVSSGEALLGAIVKLSLLEMQWSRFSAALEQFVAQGSTRVNFVQDFVARMNLFRRAVDSSRLTTALLASEQPHPFDTHPPLAVRAAAFHLAAAPIIKSSLADINDFHVPCRTMRELEEALTNVITETMHKGSDLEVDRDPSVPFELAGPY